MSLDKESLQSLFDEESSEAIGQLYEEKFAAALNELEVRGEVRGFRFTKRFSREDRAGIDCWIELERNHSIPFQITSTKRHRMERSQLHPEIPGLHVRDRHGLKSTERLARQILSRLYRFQFKMALRALEQEGKISSWKSTRQEHQIRRRGIDYLVVSTKDQVFPFTVMPSLRHTVAREALDPKVRLVPIKDESGWKSLAEIKEEIMKMIAQEGV